MESNDANRGTSSISGWKEKNELPDKINQVVASQNTGKDHNELSDESDRLWMWINILKVSKENLSRSRRAQVVEEKIKAIIISLTELQ